MQKSNCVWGQVEWKGIGLLLALAACLAGCSKGNQLGYVQHEEQLFPVEGTVLVDGKPATNAVVILHRPDAPSAGGSLPADPLTLPPNPTGDCDEEGHFVLGTYLARDGAPAGEYLVTVSWKDPEARNRDGETYPELLPGHYQDPRKSKLTAQVVAGENAPLVFELTQKKK